MGRLAASTLVTWLAVIPVSLFAAAACSSASPAPAGGLPGDMGGVDDASVPSGDGASDSAADGAGDTADEPDAAPGTDAPSE